MKIVCAACHLGQARALELVAKRLVQCGHAVTVILDKDHVAAGNFLAEEKNALKFWDCEVIQMSGKAPDALNAINVLLKRIRPDRVLVMLSPTENTENVEHQLSCIAKMLKIPVFGYAEVPCGHLAPVWNGFLPEFQTLFVAQETGDLRESLNVMEVGSDTPPVDLAAALRTKQRLGMTEGAQWIWYSGGPYIQSGIILQNIVEFIHRFDSRIKIVFTRHHRDRDNEQSSREHLKAVCLAQEKKVCVVENRPKDETGFIHNMDLLNACALDGIVITGHGTDGMMHAPRMEIPSILCVGETLNPHIMREKRHDVLPLPIGCPIQVIAYPLLFTAIVDLFRGGREDYQESCREHYPRQEKSSAQIIAEEMTVNV